MDTATTRRLAAILSADVAGYSRLMGADEVGTHQALTAHLRVAGGLIAAHGGRIVGTAGDAILAEFASAVEAVSCAVEFQRALKAANDDLPSERQMRFRIGINLGDVIVDGSDLFGDGVNVAARLQAIADPGSVCISGSVHEQVKNKLALNYRSLGHQKVKNIAEPVRAFAIDGEAPEQPGAKRARKGLRASKALRAGVFGAAALIATAALTLWYGVPLRAPSGAPETSTAAVAPTDASGGKIRTVKPSIAVLPFTNLGSGADQDYFSDGLTEDLIAALGRFSGLSVIARNAVVAYKGATPTYDEVRQALKVDYLVEGSVRKAGDQVRVAVQLTDTANGVHLWSDRFDREMTDVFALQDEITRQIASALAIRLSRVEQARAAAKPTENLAAYDLLLRGRERMARGTRTANREARALFERVIAMDPRYAAAYAALGWTYNDEAKSGWTEFPNDAMDKAERAAQKALDLDPATAEAHRLLGVVYLFRGQYDLAIAELERAIEINQSDAESYAALGGVLIWSGRSAEAVQAVETAYSLDPSLGLGAPMFLGMAYYLQSRPEDAVRVLERGLTSETNPLFRAYSHVALAAAYAELGRMQEAAHARDELLRLSPFFEAEDFVSQFKTAADRERIAAGLRRAGFIR